MVVGKKLGPHGRNEDAAGTSAAKRNFSAGTGKERILPPDRLPEKSAEKGDAKKKPEARISDGISWESPDGFFPRFKPA